MFQKIGFISLKCLVFPVGVLVGDNGELHLSEEHAQTPRDGSQALYAKNDNHGSQTPKENPFTNPEQKQPPSSYEV